MSKFKQNQLLKNTLQTIPSKKVIETVQNVPTPNTKNRQGFDAYIVEDELRLLSMLNTLKLEPQYYRTEGETMVELRDLIFKIAKKDPYFVAQCIVYSRCVGEGMRSINHLAAALLAPYISGQEWGSRFYSLWDKKQQKGGCIFRPDDMSEIINIFSALNKTKATNAMKKGFAHALEALDGYSILKYKKPLFDVMNLCHPVSSRAIGEATLENGTKVKALDAIKQNLSVSAETWEVAQSEAGQIVAKAVKEGKLTKAEAEKVLTETKAANWNQLLDENKLGILAALRNIRNMIETNADTKKLCALLRNGTLIKQGKIMPYQIDMAMTILSDINFRGGAETREVMKALNDGYVAALPNLKDMLPGRNVVFLDVSGSMGASINCQYKNNHIRTGISCARKASLIAATIALATNADIILFEGSARYYNYSPNTDVFTLANNLCRGSGWTNLQSAWDLAANSGKKYDRVFILSDNECNVGSSYKGYTNYLMKCGDPYVYSVDLAAYGTTVNAGPKVRFYYGYGLSMFDDIATSEFNPAYHIEKVRKIVI